MQIKVVKQEEKVYLNIDGELKEFKFDTIDGLIDNFVELEKDDFKLEVEDESLNNYKSLIQNVFDESKNTDFINAYNELNKKEITNEEIVKAIGDNQE